MTPQQHHYLELLRNKISWLIELGQLENAEFACMKYRQDVVKWLCS